MFNEHNLVFSIKLFVLMFTFKVASLIQPLDVEVKKFIKEMVSQNGYLTPSQMKILIENHLRNSIFKGGEIPPKTNSRFWPSNKQIRNHIGLARKNLRNSNIDQVLYLILLQSF